MTSPRQTLRDLKRGAKKSLGQHFLKDPKMVARLLAACPLAQSACVVEVGPGLGAMTEGLLEAVPKLIAVETDHQLARRLADLHAAALQSGSFSLLDQDILTVDFDVAVESPLVFGVVGNLPYNLSTAIVFHLLRWKHRIPWMGLMVQKEVAQRLAAVPGQRDFGRLSVLPQIFYSIVPKVQLAGGSFEPPTKVDSSFILLTRREKPLVDLSSPKFAAFFEKFLLDVFRFRRKTLRNVLAGTSGLNAAGSEAMLRAVQIDPQRRSETLEIDEIHRLASAIFAQSAV